MKRKILLLVAVLLIAGCAAATSNNAQAGVETSAQLALTTQLAVLKRPCTDEVKTACITRDAALKLHAIRITLRESLLAYRAASAAYKSAGTEDAEAAVKATRAALSSAIAGANNVLGLAEVQAALTAVSGG